MNPFDKNIEQLNETEQKGGFWHGGWGFFIFFIGIVGLLIAISYFVKWLL